MKCKEKKITNHKNFTYIQQDCGTFVYNFLPFYPLVMYWYLLRYTPFLYFNYNSDKFLQKRLEHKNISKDKKKDLELLSSACHYTKIPVYNKIHFLRLKTRNSPS